MSVIQKPTSIFISDGTALPTGGSSITTMASGDIGVIKSNMTAMTAGETVADSAEIFLASVSAASTNPLKRSNVIRGRKVKNYRGQSYAAASREVWTIGHNRDTGVGTIETNNETEYTFSISLTNAKNLYSERQMRFSKSFTTDASATQAEIAAAVYNAINNDESLSQLVEAIIVADGTGAPTQTISGASYIVYGGTGATDYGVEIMGKELTQFSTDYLEQRVAFTVNVDDTTGFGTTTTCTQLNAMDMGSGTYQQVYNMENWSLGYEGLLNRTMFPTPIQTYQASSAFLNSSALAETSNGTTGEDTVTFSASVAYALSAGDKVVIDGVNHEIKYFVSTTVAVLVDPLTTTNAAGAVLKRFQYDIVNIEFEDDQNRGSIDAVSSAGAVVIAVPAINASGAYNSLSTAGTGLLAILNPYMASVDFAPISL